MGQKKPWAQPVLRDKCQLPQLPANGFITGRDTEAGREASFKLGIEDDSKVPRSKVKAFCQTRGSRLLICPNRKTCF